MNARRVAEIQPEAREVELGTEALHHAEHVAVEVSRPMNVVAEHEVVLETLQRHRAPRFAQAVYRIRTRPFCDLAKHGPARGAFLRTSAPTGPAARRHGRCDAWRELSFAHEAGPLAHRFVPRPVMS